MICPGVGERSVVSEIKKAVQRKYELATNTRSEDAGFAVTTMLLVVLSATRQNSSKQRENRRGRGSRATFFYEDPLLISVLVVRHCFVNFLTIFGLYWEQCIRCDSSQVSTRGSQVMLKPLEHKWSLLRSQRVRHFIFMPCRTKGHTSLRSP